MITNTLGHWRGKGRKKPAKVVNILTRCTILFCACCSLCGCANSLPAQAEYGRIKASYEQAYGPESGWTLQQRAEFLDEIGKVHARRQAAIDSQPAFKPITMPTIKPPVFESPQPYQSSTSRIEPDGRGGYTVWNGDGTTSKMVPDGHGGWTVYH